MHRLSHNVKADLRNIWLYLYRESGSEAVADQQIDAIVERFYLLADYPLLGRARDADLGAGRRSFVIGDYVVIYRIEDGDVLVLRVVHGRQDIENLFR